MVIDSQRVCSHVVLGWAWYSTSLNMKWPVLSVVENSNVIYVKIMIIRCQKFTGKNIVCGWGGLCLACCQYDQK